MSLPTLVYNDGAVQSHTFVLDRVAAGAAADDQELTVRLTATAIQKETCIAFHDGARKYVISMKRSRTLQMAKDFVKSIAAYLDADFTTMTVLDTFAAETLGLTPFPTMPEGLHVDLDPGELPAFPNDMTAAAKNQIIAERNKRWDQFVRIEAIVEQRRVTELNALNAERKDEDKVRQLTNLRAIQTNAGLECSALALFGGPPAPLDVPGVPLLRWFGPVPQLLEVSRPLKLAESRHLQWVLARLAHWFVDANLFHPIFENFVAFFRVMNETFPENMTEKARVAKAKVVYTRFAATRDVQLDSPFPAVHKWPAEMRAKWDFILKGIEVVVDASTHCRSCKGELMTEERTDYDALRMRQDDIARDQYLSNVLYEESEVKQFMDNDGFYDNAAVNARVLAIHAERRAAQCCDAVPYMRDGRACASCSVKEDLLRQWSDMAKAIGYGKFTWNDCAVARRVVDSVSALPKPTMEVKFCPTCRANPPKRKLSPDKPPKNLATFITIEELARRNEARIEARSSSGSSSL